MAGASITVDLSQLVAADGQLMQLVARGKNLRPLMEAIGEATVTQTEERFETETAPDGSRWEPSQRVLQFGGKTLTLGGFLGGSTDYRAGDDQVETGSNLVYARPQHLGWPERNIPARPIYGLSAANAEELIELTAEHLLGGLAA